MLITEDVPNGTSIERCRICLSQLLIPDFRSSLFKSRFVFPAYYTPCFVSRFGWRVPFLSFWCALESSAREGSGPSGESFSYAD